MSNVFILMVNVLIKLSELFVVCYDENCMQQFYDISLMLIVLVLMSIGIIIVMLVFMFVVDRLYDNLFYFVICYGIYIVGVFIVVMIVL